MNYIVVAKKSLSTSSIGTAHRVNIEVDWDGCSTKGAVARRRDTRDGDAESKFGDEAEVTVRERSVRRRR